MWYLLLQRTCVSDADFVLRFLNVHKEDKSDITTTTTTNTTTTTTTTTTSTTVAQ